MITSWYQYIEKAAQQMGALDRYSAAAFGLAP